VDGFAITVHPVCAGQRTQSGAQECQTKLAMLGHQDKTETGLDLWHEGPNQKLSTNSRVVSNRAVPPRRREQGKPSSRSELDDRAGSRSSGKLPAAATAAAAGSCCFTAAQRFGSDPIPSPPRRGHAVLAEANSASFNALTATD